jgi:predicted nucleic acid-binding protein
MARRIDPRLINSLIDANVLDRVGGPEDTVVDQVLTLHEDGKILLMLPHSVKAEIEHPNTPPEVKRRALALIYTKSVSLTPAEVERHQKVRKLVRGNARAGRHDRDAYHMVGAAKYGGYFITRDERLIRKRSEIAGLLGQGFAIVTPTEFLEIYERLEEQRR